MRRRRRSASVLGGTAGMARWALTRPYGGRLGPMPPDGGTAPAPVAPEAGGNACWRTSPARALLAQPQGVPAPASGQLAPRRQRANTRSTMAEGSGGAVGTGSGATFYRYRDGQGRVVIVDALERVPSSARPSAESVVLSPPPRSATWGLPRELPGGLHGPSFVAGATCTLLLGLLALAFRRGGGPALRIAIFACVMLVGVGGYFGWLRRMTGQSAELTASPGALIQDARNAVDKMNERVREQQRVLGELEAEH